MRAIIVDDEPVVIKNFLAICAGLRDLSIVGAFENAEDAIFFAKSESVEIAFLDIEMPVMTGLVCAEKLRALYPQILIVFVSEHEKYIRDANKIGADYFIAKPCERETLEMLMPKMNLLKQRQNKNVSIQMFGRFFVKNKGKPVALNGKAKEILALVATRCGKEITNEELYMTIWENRTYDNVSMKVYYNALRRLKDTLAENGISDLLISTSRGQMINLDLVDCDYYEWKNGNGKDKHGFDGEFCPEYSWGEYILGDILEKEGYFRY